METLYSAMPIKRILEITCNREVFCISMTITEWMNTSERKSRNYFRTTIWLKFRTIMLFFKNPICLPTDYQKSMNTTANGHRHLAFSLITDWYCSILLKPIWETDGKILTYITTQKRFGKKH